MSCSAVLIQGFSQRAAEAELLVQGNANRSNKSSISDESKIKTTPGRGPIYRRVFEVRTKYRKYQHEISANHALNAGTDRLLAGSTHI